MTALDLAPMAVHGDPWPEPQPLEREPEDPLPFPVDSLPEVIQAAVRDVEAATQAPVALVVNSALAALSLAGQHVADVERDAGLRGPASLFVVTIAGSGERKSAVDGWFSRPLRGWERDRRSELADADSRYRAAVDRWTAEHDGIAAALKAAARKGSDTTALGLRLEAHELRRPVPVRLPRLFYVDSSTEKLVAHMADAHGWPSAASWSAEAGTIVGGYAFGEDSRLRSATTLNALWSGEPLYVDRIGRGSVRAEGRRLTLNWAMQPGVFAEFRGRGRGIVRATGLFARCLIAEPPSRLGVRPYRSAPASMPGFDRFAGNLTELLSHPLPLDEAGALVPPVVRFSPAARSAWIIVHDMIEAALGRGGELHAVADWAAKASEHVARLAVLFEMIERAGVPSEVSEHSIAGAAALVLWYAREVVRIIGDGEGPTSDAADLEHFIAQHGGMLPRRTVHNGGPAVVRDGRRLDAAVEVLHAAGRARTYRKGKSQLIELHPDLRRVAP